MSWLPESQDRLPLTWWKGHPIFLAAILAIVGAASMVVTAVLMAAGGGVITSLVFSCSNVMRGWIWTPLTYVLVNPPSIMLLITSYFLWRFGEEVERHLGRRIFVQLVVGLILVEPLMLTLIALAGGPRDWSAAGIWQMEFGVFIAFATLYPTAKLSLILFTIDAWIMAAALVGISALSSLANRDWAGLFMLAGMVLFAHGYMRYEQGRWTWPSLSFLKRVRRSPGQRSRMPRDEQDDAMPARNNPEDRVDAILEKIHREGLQSLTEDERRVMERASERLRGSGD
jgi:hypothetical protein